MTTTHSTTTTKAAAWWHWTGRSACTGPGKLLWLNLERRYGPLEVIHTPERRRR